MPIRYIGLSLLLFLGSKPAFANDDIIKKADLLLAYFDCAVFAELAQPSMQLTLFNKGLKVGREYYESQLSGRVTQDMTKSIPRGVWLRDGPTPDFLLGSLWTDRFEWHWDKVEQHYTCGIYSPKKPHLFECKDWYREEMYQQNFREKNCALLP